MNKPTANSLKKRGLIFIENFISEEDGLKLISDIENFKINHTKRITNHGPTNFTSIYFGKRYLKTDKSNNDDIPDFLQLVCKKIIHEKLLSSMPLGIAINEYQKGQKISAHIDRPESGDTVTILSLCSEATMVLSNTKKSEKFELNLTQNSLIQMKNEIRYDWTHEILPVKNKRYSIMFR